MRLLRRIWDYLRRGPHESAWHDWGDDDADEPVRTPPPGLLGRGWRAWRNTALDELPDDAADPLAWIFAAGASWAYAELRDATVDREAIDVAVWAKIAADLWRYDRMLRADAGRAASSRPSSGDLGRRPTTPLPGPALDLSVYTRPERGLS